MTKAETILAQLGGNKFLAMTGAKHLINHDDGLSFKLPKKAKDGINYVRITHDAGTDTYTLKFQEVKRGGLEFNDRGEQFLVYAHSLQAIFTARTGLDTHL